MQLSLNSSKCAVRNAWRQGATTGSGVHGAQPLPHWQLCRSSGNDTYPMPQHQGDRSTPAQGSSTRLTRETQDETNSHADSEAHSHGPGYFPIDHEAVLAARKPFKPLVETNGSVGLEPVFTESFEYLGVPPTPPDDQQPFLTRQAFDASGTSLRIPGHDTEADDFPSLADYDNY